MAFNKSGDFSYEADPDFNHIIDEKGNSFIALRRIKWGTSEEFRLDLRKYFNTAEGERMNKGVSFLTEDGPNELVNVMTGLGFGNTVKIIDGIKDREDFRSALNQVLSPDDDLYDKDAKDISEGYYDPKDISLF